MFPPTNRMGYASSGRGKPRNAIKFKWEMQEKFEVNEFSRGNQCRLFYLSHLYEVVRSFGFYNFRQKYDIPLEYSLESILKHGRFIFMFFVCCERSEKTRCLSNQLFFIMLMIRAYYQDTASQKQEIFIRLLSTE